MTTRALERLARLAAYETLGVVAVARHTTRHISRHVARYWLAIRALVTVRAFVFVKALLAAGNIVSAISRHHAVRAYAAASAFPVATPTTIVAVQTTIVCTPKVAFYLAVRSHIMASHSTHSLFAGMPQNLHESSESSATSESPLLCFLSSAATAAPLQDVQVRLAAPYR